MDRAASSKQYYSTSKYVVVCVTFTYLHLRACGQAGMRALANEILFLAGKEESCAGAARICTTSLS